MSTEQLTLTQYLDRRLKTDPKFRAEYNRLMKVNKPKEIVFSEVQQPNAPHLRQVTFLTARAHYNLGKEVYVRNPVLGAVAPVYQNQPGNFLDNVLRVSGIDRGFEIFVRTVRKCPQ